MGIAKTENIEEVARNVATGGRDRRRLHGRLPPHTGGARVRRDHLRQHDLVIESKARGTPGQALYGQKVVGTGPFEFIERKLDSHVLYKRVEHHWRQTPACKSSSSAGAGGRHQAGHPAQCEVHISDVPAACRQEAVAKRMQVL